MASFVSIGNYTTSYEDLIILLELGLGISGFIGNLLVCLTICSVKFLHNKTNYLIFSLALADLIVCLLAITLNTQFTDNIPQNDVVSIGNVSFIKSEIAGEFFCRLVISKYLYWSSTTASVFFLVAVTLERYMAIVYPFRHRRFFTSGRLGYMTIGIWIWGFFEESYLAIFTNYEAPEVSCKYNYSSDLLKTFVPIWAFTWTFVIPLVMLVFMNVHMIVTLQQSCRNHLHKNRQAPVSLLASAKRKMVQIIFAVVAAFVIFLAPCQLTFFLYHFGISFKNHGHIIKTVLYIMPLANSVINPVIYCLIYHKFRIGMTYFFRGCPKTVRVSQATCNQTSIL